MAPGPAGAEEPPSPAPRLHALLAAGIVLAGASTIAGPAAAECHPINLSLPSGFKGTHSEQFRWVGDCSAYRMWFSPGGTFAPGDVTVLPWQTSTGKSLAPSIWEMHAATDWSVRVSWKVEGRAQDGSTTFTTTRALHVDPNLDYDGVTVGGEDCDALDPDTHPGAVEQCDNGIDDDCDDAIDEGCGMVGAVGVGDAPGDQEGQARARAGPLHASLPRGVKRMQIPPGRKKTNRYEHLPDGRPRGSPGRERAEENVAPSV